MSLLSGAEVNKEHKQKRFDYAQRPRQLIKQKQHCSLSGAEMSNNSIKSFNSKKSIA